MQPPLCLAFKTKHTLFTLQTSTMNNIINILPSKIPNFQNPKLIITLLILPLYFLPSSSSPPPPPLPILPIPNNFQLQWQIPNMALFLHFGINTFTDSEWGSGETDAAVFNPINFDAGQWIAVAKSFGFSRVILTAKHHDGFCLWPSEYTNYTVAAASKWKGGKGDVVAAVSAAAKDAGIGFGVYLSPWDRHEGLYGDTVKYNQFYLAQLTELLTRYGEIKEVWLDGAKGKGEKEMEYLFETWFSVIHQLQPEAIIFSDAGPDARWVGNEAGVGAPTCWSLFNTSATQIGAVDPLYSCVGDPFGPDWVPAECDVSIRPGWFWHASESPKSAKTLLDIYYKSVGRNCVLLLNVPPNSSGLISPQDIQVLQEFNDLRNSIFSHNLASNSVITASSTRGGGETGDSHFSPYNVLEDDIHTYWAPEENQASWELYINLPESVSFNVVKLQEPIQMGQRVIEFHMETIDQKGVWKRVVNGTTIGYQRLLQLPKVVSSKNLKLVIDKSRADPLVSYFGIYIDQVTIFRNVDDIEFVPHFNGTQVLQNTNTTTHNDSQSDAM